MFWASSRAGKGTPKTVAMEVPNTAHVVTFWYQHVTLTLAVFGCSLALMFNTH